MSTYLTKTATNRLLNYLSYRCYFQHNQHDSSPPPKLNKNRAKGAIAATIIIALIAIPAGNVVKADQKGKEFKSELDEQRAFLFPECPRTINLSGFNSPKSPVESYTEIPEVNLSYTPPKTAAILPQTSNPEPLGSGLPTLAKWLDTPLERHSWRKSWQISGPWLWHTPDGTHHDYCLVLIEGCFSGHSKAPSASGPLPKVIACDDKNKNIENHNLGFHNRQPLRLSWQQEWLDLFGLCEAPTTYAEIEFQHTEDLRAIRLLPRIAELPQDHEHSPDIKVFLSFYAAVWLDGEEVGISAAYLHSHPARIPTLLPHTFIGHEPLWLPLRRTPQLNANDNRSGLLSVIAVLHQSRRISDVDSHLAKILGEATINRPWGFHAQPWKPATDQP
ncbi:hypothetical protein [Thiorhodococcus fuscus]|uniref:Uncharacterized protein n=1 Tax=Thiorhodococcus fuscus TaxID=527200 RepID=A0ABW4YDK9_9GAMM